MPRYKDDGYPRNVYWCPRNRRFYHRKKVGGKNTPRIWLGETEAQMWQEHARLFGNNGSARRILRDAAELFRAEEAPKKSKTWVWQFNRIIDNVIKTFGECDPVDITTPQIQMFLNKIAKKSLATAHQTRATLKTFFKFMMACPVDPNDPLSETFLPLYTSSKRGQVTNVVDLTKLDPMPVNDYVPPEQDFWSFWRVARPQIKVAALIARSSGMRISDVLIKTSDDIDDDGMRNEQQKRQRHHKPKRKLIEMDGYVRLALLISKQLQEKYDSKYLIPVTKGPRKGGCYSLHGFESLWKVDMHKAMAQDDKPVSRWFTFHSIRNMVGTEQDNDLSAANLLGNTVAVAHKHYRHGYERVRNEKAPEKIPEELWREYVQI